MTLSRRAAAPALAALGLLLCACPDGSTSCDPLLDDCTDGGLPPDWCDSRQQADDDAVHCHVPLGRNPDGGGAFVVAYISTLGDGGIDKDWYLVQTPAGLTGRSLLHLNAGYVAPQTGVNFDVNVLLAGDAGLVSIATGTDVHGTAAPRPVDLVIPFSQSSARVYLLVGDKQTGLTTHVDNRNAYSVLAEVMDNPDPNEPNDATPTPVPLTSGNGGLQGAAFGYLATDGDVDRYSFSMGLAGRQIIYLHLVGSVPSAPDGGAGGLPPWNFGRLSYTLFDPDGVSISEGTMDNAFLDIDLATARLAPKLGTYTVEVKGFQPANSTGTVKGDLRVRYDLQVRILPDLDTTEPNDSLVTARSVPFSGLGTQTLAGKLSYIPDEEWFRVTLPARASPSTLRYRVVVSGTGRFAPTSATPARQVRVSEPVTVGATSQDRQVACLTNKAACPRSVPDLLGPRGQLVSSLCKATDPPQCLYAEHDETERFTNLKNLVGAIPVDPSAAETTVYVMFRDQGLAASKYADDRDWTLTLEYADDPDRAGRLAGPTVLSGASTTASGQLTFGYGLALDPFDLGSGAGIRAPGDYDAVETDKDLYQVNVGAGEQSWAVSWDLQKNDAGVVPAELALELTYCTGAGPAPDGGLCPGQQTLIFGYSQQALSPWYQPNNSSTAVPLFARTDAPGQVTISTLPVGCECVSSRHTAAGRFFINVAAVNRVSNAPLSYTLRQTLAPYPTPATCPVRDAGCGFDAVP